MTAVDRVQAAHYDAVLRFRDGQYFFIISELNLIAQGESPAAAHAAHAALDRALREQLDRHTALGLPVPPPRDLRVRREWRERLLPFAFKTMIVTLALAALIVTATATVNYALREPLRSAAQKTARAALGQIVAGMEDFARRDLSPDREERLREALRGIVPVLRPFIEELYPLLSGPESTPAGASRQGG